MVSVTTLANVSLVDQFRSVRQRSVDLCAPLEIEDYVPQSATFASPPKWHLGHTTWFFETLILKAHCPGFDIFNEQYPYAFNSYYNHLGERVDRSERGIMTRPTVKEVYEYRAYVDETMVRWLSSNDISDEVHQLVVLGLQHEQQHQELLITDLKYTFSKNPIYPIYKEAYTICETTNPGLQRWINIPEGIYEIGHHGESFCFDNELNRHRVLQPAFALQSHLVTNGEYLEFIKDGGYDRFEYWLDEGWAWVNKHQIKAPLYWKYDGQQWFQYTLSGLRLLVADHQLCHVNFYEADAFARWKGRRLPTEFEWEIASNQIAWGNRWEWTNSAYLPYPSFTAAAGAIGEYNGKFMVNQKVLRGASTATSPNHSRNTYRNFFHPHYRWQATGIRLAQ